MTTEKSWTASDGAQFFYRCDDFTDPWKKAPLVVLLHPGLGSSLNEDYTERLPQLDMPVLMAVPDPMVERSEYERMRRHLRRCTYVTMPGAAHSMTAEIPDACAQVLKTFLSDVEKS